MTQDLPAGEQPVKHKFQIGNVAGILTAAQLFKPCKFRLMPPHFLHALKRRIEYILRVSFQFLDPQFKCFLMFANLFPQFWESFKGFITGNDGQTPGMCFRHDLTLTQAVNGLAGKSCFTFL